MILFFLLASKRNVPETAAAQPTRFRLLEAEHPPLLALALLVRLLRRLFLPEVDRHLLAFDVPDSVLVPSSVAGLPSRGGLGVPLDLLVVRLGLLPVGVVVVGVHLKIF